ncbi:bromodomain-containing protein DDB_G0280777-like [Camellia sinensis]|uniref:bromodomain-containing protein DDB_G0280777-like n=1 Tax=Camellia sinensis TaxID=4442 RepID=UPI0010361B16|nr:bromodomain-containing protein DDB_G0280777-like [Camellia sinensis]
MDQQRDIICGSTVHQPQEFGESKDAQIADLRQRLKALSQSKKEEERNWIKLLVEKDIAIRILTSLHLELQEKESTIQIKLRMLEVEKEDDTKTIQQLRCSNSELEIENAKLHEQVQELSVQLATQPYRTPTQLQPQVGMQVEQQPTTQQEQIPHKQQPKQKKKLYGNYKILN